MRKYYICVTIFFISISIQGWGSNGSVEINKSSRELSRETVSLVPEFNYTGKVLNVVSSRSIRDAAFLTVNRKGSLNVSGLGDGWWDLYLIAHDGEVLVRKKIKSDIGILLSEYDVPAGSYLMQLSQGDEKKEMNVVVHK